MKSKIKFGTIGGLLVICIAVSLFCTSCLKHGLPSYPTYNLNYINHVYFEYRWLDSSNVSYGSPVVTVENLAVTQQIDSANNTITCQITVPPASGDFDAYQRNLVSLDSIWCVMDVSPAATIAPMGGAPKLSFQGNYSFPQEYQVTAANGDKRTWTIQVTSFIK